MMLAREIKRYIPWLIILAVVVVIIGVDNGPAVFIADNKIKVTVVADEAAWRQGLSGWDSLAEGEGMLFAYPDKDFRTFWMKDMNFNIDLLWIDDNKVIGWQKYMVAPPLGVAASELMTYRSPLPVNFVLELPAGSIDAMNIEINDEVNFRL